MATWRIAAAVATAILSASPSHADPQADVRAVVQGAAAPSASAETQAAWRRLAGGGAEALVPILEGMKGADAAATNWLRTAFDAAMEQQNGVVATDGLHALLRDRTQSPNARRTAYEWIVKLQPDAEAELLDEMVTDPAPELRYDAVARLTQQAGLAEGDERTRLLQSAFEAALDVKQKEELAKRLGEGGVEVDLAGSLGYVMTWRIVGPFDSTGGVGFAKAYPPESSTDAATYEGQKGEVAWKAAASDDDFGLIDLTEVLGPFKGAAAYAEAVVRVPVDTDAELRYTSRNATKVWVNGRQAASNEVYHSGHSIDQYAAPCRLVAGENRLLLKVCQNEQTEPWAQSWEFQLRLCDAIGAAIEFETVDP